MSRSKLIIAVWAGYMFGVLNERSSPGDHMPWNATAEDWLAFLACTCTWFILWAAPAEDREVS